MNKVLIGTLTLAFGVLAHANSVTCTTSPTQIANGIGTATLTCAAIDAGAGFTIGSLELLLASDYINGPIGTTSGTSVQVIYAPSADFSNHTELVTGGFSSSGSTTDGVTNTGGGPFLAQTISVGTETLASFTLFETSSVTSGGPVNASTVNAYLVYTPTSSSSAPEPGSMMLLGSGLLAAGLIGRKKLVRK
jgi:hypothetical protein